MILRFPPPDEPWSVNEVPPSVRAKIRLSKRKQNWRDAAFYAANQALRSYAGEHNVPANVAVSIPFRTKRRRDPHNYTGTVVKAIVDGLVLARVWPDDNPDWVTVLEPTLLVGNEVTVVITARQSGVTVLG